MKTGLALDRAETVIRNWGPEEITECIGRDAPGILWMAMADKGPAPTCNPVFYFKNSLGCEQALCWRVVPILG